MMLFHFGPFNRPEPEIQGKDNGKHKNEEVASDESEKAVVEEKSLDQQKVVQVKDDHHQQHFHPIVEHRRVGFVKVHEKVGKQHDKDPHHPVKHNFKYYFGIIFHFKLV
jgi:hypothetical protein